MKKTICAVIVTYNRKEYLSKLLEALRFQTRRLDGVLIFDNHSSDGTDHYLLALQNQSKKKFCIKAARIIIFAPLLTQEGQVDFMVQFQ